MKKFYSNESGCHRWVRIPPTEKNGRTQTSTITVAIIDPNNKFEYKLNRSDVTRQYTCSGGKGGQNINRRRTAVQLTHIPTGTQVKCQDTREQGKNEDIAWIRLEEKIKQIEEEKFNLKIYGDRFIQTSASQRSDKKRTYRIKENLVIDHETGKSATFREISIGKIQLLA